MEKKTKLESILPLVQRPTRYINGEWNAHVRENFAGTRFCLCFPDIYEVGASNLGLEILYHLLNAREDTAAERCYCPAADMETKLKEAGIPLSSLETGMPLKDFDVVGFSLQYELGLTNVLAMLQMAGLPLLSSERAETFPLILGGGPVTANPEPFADFFDAFVLGEAEEAVVEIAAVVREAKEKKYGKRQLLKALAAIEGVYVPSLYAVEYNDDGTVRSVAPAETGVPETVKKRVVKLDESFFPAEQIVPYLQTVHNRLNIEIARGCPGRCRFCQASKYYFPWRSRPAEKVVELAERGLASTGYEEISFSSLSCTDYRDLEKLLDETNRRFAAKRINVTLPSLRCDQFSLNVAAGLGHNKRASLTFAPEAGTDRLRNAIGKDLPGEQIERTLALAWRMGWRQIKLYFMVGLPTETEEDVEGINRLVRSVRAKAQGLNFTVTVSPFVPKAQTPFQWAPMGARETILARVKKLERSLPAAVKSHFLEGSLLEGIFARGDRRLAKAVLSAFRKGCRFDQWKEHARYDLWEAAFKEERIDREFYLFRERGKDEVLPWDHLRFGGNKEFLRAEYERALTAGDLPAVTSQREEAGMPAAPARPERPMPQALPSQTVQRLRLRFARMGMFRFLSHLEQIELFRRAVRRSGLPVAYTAGFSPQPKIAFGPAISVGYESDSEFVEMDLARRMEPAEVEARLGKALPAGFRLRSVKKIPLFFPSLDSLVNVAEYRIGTAADEETIRRFLAPAEVIIEKKKEKKVERIDVKPLIMELSPEGSGLFLRLRFGPKKNIKPERILQELLALPEERAKLLSISRTALRIEKRDGTLSEP